MVSEDELPRPVNGVEVCQTEWGKQLGEGLFEFRVRRHAYGTKVVLLLNGYDKAGDPSDKRQQHETTLARRHLVIFKERQALERNRQRQGGGRDS